MQIPVRRVLLGSGCFGSRVCPASSHIQGQLPHGERLSQPQCSQPRVQGAMGSASPSPSGSTTDHLRQRHLSLGATIKAEAAVQPHGPLLDSAVLWAQHPSRARFLHSCGTREAPGQNAVEQSWLNSKEKHHYLELRSSQQPSRGDCSGLITVTFCFVLK